MARTAANLPKARLIEVFSAIQGEGLNAGDRQIFIRFAICDLRCHFCDSARTWFSQPTCEIEQTPGKRNFETHSNPVSMSDLLDWIERQNQPRLHDSISLTGGEPLLHAPFLQEFLPLLKERTGLPIYLETAGHLPQQLKIVLPYLDSAGMDIKLPGVSGENHWVAHAEFLQQCCQSPVEVFIKIIISGQTDPKELERAAELVAGCDRQIPVFLQPVTPLKPSEILQEKQGICPTPPTPEQVLEWQGLMKHQLDIVRVLPQTHKAIGQL